jgi:hypothetical protein
VYGGPPHRVAPDPEFEPPARPFCLTRGEIMNHTSSLSRLLTFLGLGTFALSFAGTAFAASMSTKAAPSIDGTYKLAYRELPNGTKEMPPNVEGLMTLRHGYRNFNIYWKDDKGNQVSMSAIATYKFTPTEYTEKSLFEMMNNGDGKPTYDLSGVSGQAPVSVKDGRISFQFPNHNEPSVVFDSHGMVATRTGAFTDYWEKVK